MKVSRVWLYQFRNYFKQTVDFKKRITFISGKNAYGKTNIIEAIGMLSHGKSFRDCPSQLLIMNNKNECGIQIFYNNDALNNSDKLSLTIELKNGKSTKKFFVNDKQILGISELMGRLVTVNFLPSDIHLIDGGPSNRRRFFDYTLGISDRAYFTALLKYNKLLSQRNALLKREKKFEGIVKELNQWDEMLVSPANKIRVKRNELLAEFQQYFDRALDKISGQKDRAVIENNKTEDFANSLAKNRRRDFQLGWTTTGPHRDQYAISNDGRILAMTASQGQKRSIVLALRFAQYEYLQQKLGVKPILLLDDVVRELDSDRRNLFIDLLATCGQVIITTPEIEDIQNKLVYLQEEIGIVNLVEPAKIAYQYI